MDSQEELFDERKVAEKLRSMIAVRVGQEVTERRELVNGLTVAEAREVRLHAINRANEAERNEKLWRAVVSYVDKAVRI
jgi:hypothetical protein